MPRFIERLKTERRKFESKIAEIQVSINNNNIVSVTEIIRSLADKVIHYAVEEDRLMRVVI
jgi:hypothetical protein